MTLYLAMWARGPAGNQVTRQEMADNKLYAKGVAKRLRTATESFHEVICPHEDEILDLIDDVWLTTRNPDCVPIAMSRCYALLDKCQGIVIFHRGHYSEGIKYEVQHAVDKEMFIYEADHLTDETLEDLILALNEWENKEIERIK